MSVHIVHRPARTTRPLPEPAERQVEPPPNLPEGRSGSVATSLLPMAGVTGSVVMMTVIRSSQFAALGAIVLVVALLGGVLLFFSQRGRAQRQRRAQRECYLEYLEQLREELSGEDRSRRAAAQLLSPPPEALYDLVRDPARRWERRRTDADFLDVRVGSGEVPVRVLTMAQHGSSVLTPPDTFMLNEAAGLRRRFSTAPQMPLTVPLDRAGNVSVVGGDRGAVLRAVRALVVQSSAGHAPDDLAIALACAPERLTDWEWAKWLPHVLDDGAFDGPVPARRIAHDLGALSAALAEDLRGRASYAAEVRRGLAGQEALGMSQRLLVISDGYGTAARELLRPDEAVRLSDMGVTVLHLVRERTEEPGDVTLRLTVDADSTGLPGAGLLMEDLAGALPGPRTRAADSVPQQDVVYGTVDEVTEAGADGIARMLAPLRLSPESAASGTPLAGPVDFTDLLGVRDAQALDVERLWQPRGTQAFLRVPIGLNDEREPVLLDLKESAELGMGPHGLCVGATGSGKSELLRTLVLALVTSHPPEDLSMVLVDYKGGATFAPFAELPHVAGMITNLENRAGLVERVHTSLAGEVQRRQQVLKDAGNLPDIATYAAARRQRPELEPLPHLFVVIDEFGELLTAKPDFIDLFLSIGRIGRSIGVHLLLSSQRIEGGKLRGLDTYLSYRLGLRTFSPDESRTVLDTPDAFELPSIPGFGYLKVDTSHYERFKTGYVSGSYRSARPAGSGGQQPTAMYYPAYNSPAAPQDETAGDEQDRAPAPARRTTGPTLLSVMADQLRDKAPPVQQIWLPPLPAALPLDAVAGPVETDPGGARGMRLVGKPDGALRVPLGLLDDPAGQWQGQWVLDLTVAGGHVAVIGGPQSGKTTLLRTLMLSLALTHTPQEVGIYGIDLVGSGLQSMAGLPHVGGIAGRADRERAARTVEEVRTMLVEREQLFREHGIDSVEQLRSLRAQGRLPHLPSSDIVLIVDGFGELREEFEELEEAVGDLLRRGSGYGIHVVAGMLRWNDVRIATQSSFGTRVELRLNDPGDSTVSRKLAETIAADEPGRALTDDKLFAQVALPRIDAVASADGVGDGIEEALRAVRAAWHGQEAAPVRVLPARLPAARLPQTAEEPVRIPLGLDQGGLAPVLLDLFHRDQHLLVFGDSECGKTNLLRLIADGLIARYGTDELVFAVMDPRRGLHSLVPEPYRGGYAHNARLAAGLSAGITGELEKRLPDDSVPPEVLAAGGATFAGPRIVVLIDDYDILAGTGNQPLSPFLPYLPSAPDIGLHFVITRRCSGASRALYEPFLMTLCEGGTSALVMAGDRSEGQLLAGVYPSAQPQGRGMFVRRGEPNRLVQTALAPPPSM
ncbi:type VII secretion protein EccCa [Streptomyces sioyaensis]|uniref:type VII secretion protein EccCa n=1 Tax=Streptomyces sioyaensis TaxID=67364 RepID=UPI0036675F87